MILPWLTIVALIGLFCLGLWITVSAGECNLKSDPSMRWWLIGAGLFMTAVSAGMLFRMVR